MKGFFVIIILILTGPNYGRADGCDGICNCEGRYISCLRVEFFPSFQTSGIIQAIFIMDSPRLTELKLIRADFPALVHLGVHNSPNIPCSDIDVIRSDGIEVDIDRCPVKPDTTANPTPNQVSTTIFMSRLHSC